MNDVIELPDSTSLGAIGQPLRRKEDERLLTGRSLRTHFAFAPSALDRSEPVYGPVIGIPTSRHLATGFAQAGNGSPHGMRQPAEPLPDLRDRSAFGSLEQADQLRALCRGWR